MNKSVRNLQDDQHIKMCLPPQTMTQLKEHQWWSTKGSTQMN